MSTKKLSLKYLENKRKKEPINNNETLEGRLEIIRKMKTNKNQTHRMKRNFERTRNKKYD